MVVKERNEKEKGKQGSGSCFLNVENEYRDRHICKGRKNESENQNIEAYLFSLQFFVSLMLLYNFAVI